MIRKLKKWSSWLRNSGAAQTIIGFFSFLIIAAVLMLFLESTEDGSGIKDLFNSFWFSIVTITTVGYGDLSPVSSFGKSAAVIIMFIGIVYTGVLTGNITSWLVERNRRRVFGLVPIRKKEDHFLVLGWRQGMKELLKDILVLHRLVSNQLVLVNSAKAEMVNDLRQDPLLKGVCYFHGDYTNREVLLNACAHSAGKVLIITDELSGKTAEEVDFRSILAAIAVKRVNSQIHTIAEIVQPKFSMYLQHVDVEEIILNRHSARALLCNIALMSGLNNVFSAFFSMDKGLLRIESIDSYYNGRTYKELKSSSDRPLVIGLLENTGNLRKRKQEKMNLAQKSVSIKKAIQELMDLKNTRSNVPVFHPPPNYIIKESSSMIVLNVPGGELNDSESLSETVVMEDISAKTPEQMLRHYLDAVVETTDSWKAVCEKLETVGVEIYPYANTIQGAIYGNRKYPFETLGYPPNQLAKLMKLFEKKQSLKSLVKEKVNTFFDKAPDWDTLFDLLRKEGMDLYSYRKRINGVGYEGKKFSFKILGIDDVIVTELNKIPGVREGSGVKEDIDASQRTCKSLAKLRSDLDRAKTVVKPRSEKKKQVLMICGWKPQLPEMVDFIIKEYSNHNTNWNKISIVADLPQQRIDDFMNRFGKNVDIDFHSGNIVDRDILKKAGIYQATKVIILAETESGRTFEEIDSQTVLASMMVGTLNRKAYKIAEILDKRYKESLEQANVEEIYLEDEFTRIMLSNGSHGLGVAQVIKKLINFDETSLRISEISNDYINGSFKQLLRGYYKPEEMVVGLLEETGNVHARKSERIHQAQIQSNIKGQVEELIKVKDLVPNRVIVAPDMDYKIRPNSMLIAVKSSEEEGWNTYREFAVSS